MGTGQTSAEKQVANTELEPDQKNGGGPDRISKPQYAPFTPYMKPAKAAAIKAAEKEAALIVPEGSKVVAQFVSPEGDISGPPLNLPADSSPEQLKLLLNSLLHNVN